MCPDIKSAKSFIIIVSGLPRSGTSMMMRMLEAGGMEVIVDNIRKADEDNPNGYYEFENVKKIKEDNSWLSSTYGKAFKMVSMLLYNLPRNHRYKVVFMRREMEEILASQKKMLQRSGKYAGIKDEEIRRIFKEHIHRTQLWLAKQNNIETLYVDYNETIMAAYKNIQTVNAFLDNNLDVEKMVAVIDQALYRSKVPA